MKPANKLTSEESARLAELEPVIEKGMATFVEVGAALLEISDSRLYRETHSTFKEYCEAKWNMTAARAYQLCEAAEVIKFLPETSTMVDKLNERQARELAKVPEEKRPEVLEVAQSKAAEQGKPMTARDVKEAAVEVCQPNHEDDENSPFDEPEHPRVEVEDFTSIVQRRWHKWLDQWTAEELPAVRRIVANEIKRA